MRVARNHEYDDGGGKVGCAGKVRAADAIPWPKLAHIECGGVVKLLKSQPCFADGFGNVEILAKQVLHKFRVCNGFLHFGPQLFHGLNCAQTGVCLGPAAFVCPFLAAVQFVDDGQEVFVFIAVVVIKTVYDIFGFLIQIIVQTFAHRARRGSLEDHRLFTGGHTVNNNVIQGAHRRCPCVNFVQQTAVNI